MPLCSENPISEASCPQSAPAAEATCDASNVPRHAREGRPRSKKRVLALIVALALVLALGIALGVQAYTVKQTQADNVISFGSVKIRLLETMQTDQGEQPVPDGFSEKLQGDEASRIVRIQNAGDEPCWVRVQLQMKASEGEGWIDASPAVSYGYGEGVLTGALDPDKLPAETWVYASDEDGTGWFYYTEPLQAYSGTTGADGDDLTSSLIESLDIDPDKLGDERRTYRFDIQAQAVQAKNNQDSVLEAEGWPTADTTEVGA